MRGYNSANIPSRLGEVERILPDLLRRIRHLELELHSIKNPPLPPHNIAKELNLICNCNTPIENLHFSYTTGSITIFTSDQCLICGKINQFTSTYLQTCREKVLTKDKSIVNTI